MIESRRCARPTRPSAENHSPLPSGPAFPHRVADRPQLGAVNLVGARVEREDPGDPAHQRARPGCGSQSLSAIAPGLQSGSKPETRMPRAVASRGVHRLPARRAQPVAAHAAGVRARGGAVRRVRRGRDGVRGRARGEPQRRARVPRPPALASGWRRSRRSGRSRRCAPTSASSAARGWWPPTRPRWCRRRAPRRSSPRWSPRRSSPSCSTRCPPTPAGRRDRAALELLYAAGVRASELVGLDLDDVDLTRRLARVLGKGGKERIVPFGREAERALRAYLPDRAAWRSQAGAPTDGEPLFVNQRGGRLSDRSLRRILDAAVLRVALIAAHPPAHAAARLRHPPARGRHGPAGDPGAAGARVAVHHPAVHPPGPGPPDGDLQQGAPQGVTPWRRRRGPQSGGGVRSLGGLRPPVPPPRAAAPAAPCPGVAPSAARLHAPSGRPCRSSSVSSSRGAREAARPAAGAAGATSTDHSARALCRRPVPGMHRPCHSAGEQEGDAGDGDGGAERARERSGGSAR